MKDILECRIEGVLSEIEATRLCDLPEEEAITVEEFVGATERTCQAAAETLTKYAVFHFRLRVVISVSCDIVQFRKYSPSNCWVYYNDNYDNYLYSGSIYRP